MFAIIATTVAVSIFATAAAAVDAGTQGRAVYADSFDAMCGNSAWDGLKAGIGL